MRNLFQTLIEAARQLLERDIQPSRPGTLAPLQTPCERPWSPEERPYSAAGPQLLLCDRTRENVGSLGPQRGRVSEVLDWDLCSQRHRMKAGFVGVRVSESTMNGHSVYGREVFGLRTCSTPARRHVGPDMLRSGAGGNNVESRHFDSVVWHLVF